MTHDSATSTGRVVSASRRHVQLITETGELLKATSTTKALELTIGDLVTYGQHDADHVVNSILPRKNSLARTYRGQKRMIASNLDRVFIVTAITPLFNTAFIDRVLVAAYLEGIQAELIVNKIDLDLTDIRKLVEEYERLDIPLLKISAKFGQGLDLLKDRLRSPDLSVAALCGVSGVGKSTILNKLIPDAFRKTAEVSKKTGQGRQTTTQSQAYPYVRDAQDPLLVIDLPGLQSFGIAYTEECQLAEAFPDIYRYGQECEFSNCSHLNEVDCAVRDAVDAHLIASFRYENYCQLLIENRQARGY